jgi:hypothetical protein
MHARGKPSCLEAAPAMKEPEPKSRCWGELEPIMLLVFDEKASSVICEILWNFSALLYDECTVDEFLRTHSIVVLGLLKSVYSTASTCDSKHLLQSFA